MKLDQFTAGTEPVTLVYGAANPVTIALLENLLFQKTKIILTDYTNASIKQILKKLPLQNDKLIYIEINSLLKNAHRITRLEYIFHIAYHRIIGSTFPYVDKAKHPINNRTFIQETTAAEGLLKLSAEFAASHILVLPGYLTNLLKMPDEMNLQLIEHLEILFNRFQKESKTNTRILKIGEPLGTRFDISAPTIVADILRNIPKHAQITIPGDGLLTLSLAAINDIVINLINIISHPKTKGKIIKFESTPTLSVITFIHTLSEIINKDIKVKTTPDDPGYNLLLENLEKIQLIQEGISPKKLGGINSISTEDALVETASYVYRVFNRKLDTSLHSKQDASTPRAMQDDKLKQTKNNPPINSKIGAKKLLRTALSSFFVGLIPEEKTSLYTPLEIKPFLKFLTGIFTTLLLAFITAPALLYAYYYYKLSNTVNSVRMIEPKNIETTTITLDTYYNKLSIKLPTSLSGIPILGKINKDLIKAKTISGTLKLYQEVIAPLQQYLDSKDPQSIAFLLDKSYTHPTYLAELYIRYKDLTALYPPPAYMQKRAFIIENLAKVFPHIHEWFGYTTPKKWYVVIKNDKESNILLEYSVDKGALTLLSVNTNRQFNASTLQQDTVAFVFPEKIISEFYQNIHLDPGLTPVESALKLKDNWNNLTSEEKLILLNLVLNAITSNRIHILMGPSS